MRCDQLINEIHSDLRTSWYQQKSKRYYGYIYIYIYMGKSWRSQRMYPSNVGNVWQLGIWPQATIMFFCPHTIASLHKFTGVDYAWTLNEDNIIRSLECPKSKSTPTACCHQFGYPQLLNIFGSQRIWLKIFWVVLRFISVIPDGCPVHNMAMWIHLLTKMQQMKLTRSFFRCCAWLGKKCQ